MVKKGCAVRLGFIIGVKDGKGKGWIRPVVIVGGMRREGFAGKCKNESVSRRGSNIRQCAFHQDVGNVYDIVIHLKGVLDQVCSSSMHTLSEGIEWPEDEKGSECCCCSKRANNTTI